jgi:hypothetical protein
MFKTRTSRCRCGHVGNGEVFHYAGEEIKPNKETQASIVSEIGVQCDAMTDVATQTDKNEFAFSLCNDM